MSAELPQQSDWDFPKCPPDQLEYQAVYEYARESRLVREAVAKLSGRLAVDPQFTLEFSKECFQSLGLPLSQAHFFSLLTFLGTKRLMKCFPDTPWHKIEPASVRRQIISEDLPDSVGEAGHEKDALHLEAVDCDYEGIDNQLARLSQQRRRDTGGNIVDTIEFIQFDWRYSDEQLVKNFRTWLRLARPAHVVVSERGKGLKIWTSMLKNLGAYRVLKHMSITEATEMTRSLKVDPLYADVSSWSEAKRKARAFIRQLEKTGWLGNASQMRGWVAANLSSRLS